ncbi:MAG: YtxH domain-containing protein [Thermoanaerobaculia bacterium]
MFEKKTPFRKYAFSFTGGLVAGAILGLLYAPFAGKKMQKKVAEVTDQVIDKVDGLQQTIKKFANA